MSKHTINWLPLSVHFRQRYDQGYRYLDNCGAFILDCENRLGLLPSDVKLTGATLELPESGINVTVDTSEMKAAQDNPGDNGEQFASLCAGVSELIQKHFPPALVYSNGFLWRDYQPFQDEDLAKAATLRFAVEGQDRFGKQIGMIPTHTNLHQAFTLGSKELTVQVLPITFEKVNVQTLNPRIGASQREKDIIVRRNRRAERLRTPPPYGLSLSVDLIEREPPVHGVMEHFHELLRYHSAVFKEFSA